MNLHFITSISKNYWYNTGVHCISTWNLPGKVTIYVDQKSGDLDWLKDLPYHKELLNVPPLKGEYAGDRAKVRKFWGKSAAQIDAIRNRGKDERIIWLDADIEQTAIVDASMFTFSFKEPIAMMYSGDFEDCWESGLVIFNQENEKLNLAISKYENAWNDAETLKSLWKPYDAQVLGHIAKDREYLNLCHNKCSNSEALATTRYAGHFKHWINKNNKELLKNKNGSNDSSDIS